MFNRDLEGEWISRLYNRFMYEVLFVTPQAPWNLCMKHGTIEMVEQETHDRFTGDQIKEKQSHE